ncbi:MAG TPA: hypothetical protein VHI98_22575, partial [Vicinamibacterales bacterium]|nr:hypothetical protein [Vicinamibacterales bacterium]
MSGASQAATDTPGNVRREILSLLAENIPAELIARDRWLVWKLEARDGKLTKIPYCATKPHAPASSTDPATWATFSSALATVEDGKCDGVGFVLGDGFAGGISGVDLDDCRDPETGTIADWALTITDTLNSYTEISPTGTGLKIFARGTLPPGGRRKGLIEMYPGDRYFTVTGHHLPGTPKTVEAREAQLAALHAETFRRNGTRTTTFPRPAGPVDLDDVQLLNRARHAKNGDRFDRLFSGDWSDYQSRSEADLALCSLLAFWTGNDHSRMDRLFRQSGLARGKWDTRRGAQTYADLTIRKAISTTIETFKSRGIDDRKPQHHPDDENRAPSSFARTDAGNAELFAFKHGGDVRFDFTAQVWRIWKTHYWALDRDGAVQRMAKATIRARLTDGAGINHDEDRKHEVRWATQSESRRGLDALLALAQSEHPLAVSGDDWDRHPWLFGVQNGVIDLQTGLRRDGQPGDGLTKVSPVIYDPAATCP